MKNQGLLTFMMVLFPCLLLVLAISLLHFGREASYNNQIDQTISRYFIALNEKNAISLCNNLFPSFENEDYAESLLKDMQNVDSISLESIRAVNAKENVAFANVVFVEQVGNEKKNSSAMLFLRKVNGSWFIAKPSDLSIFPQKEQQAYIKTYSSPIWHE